VEMDLQEVLKETTGIGSSVNPKLPKIKSVTVLVRPVKDLHLKMYIPYTFNYAATIIT